MFDEEFQNMTKQSKPENQLKHKLLQNLTEYRKWAWNYYVENWTHNLNAANALGLLPTFECWDTIRDENGELVDIDEEGNVIPEDTAETVALQDWMNEVQFPAVAVYFFAKEYHRNVNGDDEIYVCDFVSLSEFSKANCSMESDE